MGLLTTVGKMHFGASYPAKPALMNPDPLSIIAIRSNVESIFSIIYNKDKKVI